jgi:hypothetical protein
MDRRMAICAIMFRNRLLAAGMAALAAGLAVPPINADAQQGESAITCTNPVSGTAWQIRIDYAKATVDANPARITQGAISWFDPKDSGHYSLDRASGDLTTSVASSTGGYFRHARCNLETPR